MQTMKRRWVGGLMALIVGTGLAFAGCADTMMGRDTMMGDKEMKKEGGMMKDDKSMMEKK